MITEEVSNMKSYLHLPCIFLLIYLSLTLISCDSGEAYLNPKLPVDKRVEDLISRLTTEEKISQMIDKADSIPRLGIPEYNWWNEGLHGVARAGTATVFPQAIGLAASFDTEMMLEVSTMISTEFRAKYNHYQSLGETDRYKGLTVWSPNINIFRDPRWGRGQETYGEDPYLTSRMAVSFIRGLQGDHPKYLKTVATPKHYAVHSGPEPLRHSFDVDVSQRDLMMTYLPAFEASIREADAQSIMSAYNRFRGLSASGSPYLLNEILREKWGFEGYVVSDCGAIFDIYAHHKLVGSEAKAAAVGVRSGCDLNCGYTYLQLKTALDSGYLVMADIDLALTRLFRARFQMGMFDPPEMVPYNDISYNANDSEAHRQLSIEAARKSMVLLKNEEGILPLSKNTGKIAVIGPNADDAEVMYGNYNGFPSKSVTPLEGIRKIVGPETEVVYARGCNLHAGLFDLEPVSWENLSSYGEPGLTGEYFNNPNLEGSPFAVRQDSVMRLSWFNKAPLPGMSRENFSIRWQGILVAPKTGKYLIRVAGDDGFRLFFEDQLILDTWESGGGWQDESFWVELKEGEQYAVELDYYQRNWGARISLEWLVPSDDTDAEALQLASESDVVIFFGGLSPQLEGEEMNVQLSGFSGGDRTTISLPEVQVDLLKQLHALGKPVILVLMNGSALAVNWSSENLPAILEAWYPGQEGGTAIAEVLFGEYNPAGRLPLTFYRSVDQLPPFEDYTMEGRTYRYFRGEPLFDFGYGLSYTEFQYENLIVPEQVKTDEQLTIRVDITNTGVVDGEEVVQLYIRHLEPQFPAPIHSLQGVRRIFLKAGETRTVEFIIEPRQLSLVDDDHQWIVIPGEIQVFAGGKQPKVEALPAGNLVSKKIILTGSPFITGRLDP